MKYLLHPKKLPFFAAAAGLITTILRLSLFLLGRDEKNLLITGHPLDILTWAVTAAAAIVILLTVRKLDGSSRYGDNFAPSAAAAIGAFVLAGGIAVSAILGGSSGLRLEVLCRFCGVLAVPSVVWAGLCRWKGKRPFFGFHALVCLYLTLYTITSYQTWSSHPQIQDWFFNMIGIVCLALFSYYQTAFDAGMGNRRMQLLTGLLGAFFCLATIAGSEDILLYIGGAVWTLTNLCNLTPVSRRRKNPITEDIADEPA